MDIIIISGGVFCFSIAYNLLNNGYDGEINIFEKKMKSMNTLKLVYDYQSKLEKDVMIRTFLLKMI